MRHNVPLVLNAAILLVNFAVSLGSTDTQIQIARAAVRTVAEPAPAPAPPAAPVEDPRAPAVRLVKYLARLRGLETLSPDQIEALRLAHDYCWQELTSGGEQLRGADYDGARTRIVLSELRARVSRNVEATLKAANVPEGELLARLVRIVMASAG